MSFNANAPKPKDLIHLDNDILLSLPISVGVLLSRQRLKFWQSKALTNTVFNLNTYNFVIQFLLFYFVIRNKNIALLFLALLVAHLFISVATFSKSDFILEPNRFYKGKIDYYYTEILKVHKDRLELSPYFKKNQGIIYCDNIKYIKAHCYKINKGLKIKYNSPSIKRMGKIRYRFFEQLLEILSSNIVLNKKYGIELNDLANIISRCSNDYKNKL